MALDPARYPHAKLADPAHKLPFGGRLFGHRDDMPGFERVDLFDSFVQMLLAGGSIVLADPPGAALQPPSDPDA